MDWHPQKLCTDIGEYELVLEKQKNQQHCEQKRESWKWIVNYHGAVVASGSCNSEEEAKEMAIANTPK